MMNLRRFSLSELRTFAVGLFAALAVSNACAVTDEKVREVYGLLDHALERRAGYIAKRQHRIDSLVSLSADRKSIAPEVLMQIADAYTSFSNDSALTFLAEGCERLKGAEGLPFKWKHASLLPLSGFFEIAQREYDSIDVDSVPPDELASYYDAGRQLHSYIASFFSHYPAVREPHRQRSLELQEKLLEHLDAETPEYKFQLGEYYFLTGRRQMARVLLEEVVDHESAASNIRARAAHHLSTIARDAGDENSYRYYLAVSALADVLTATREMLSLQELGTEVYYSGDVARAHRYLSNALESAVECGAPLRMVDASKSLPIIERSHLQHIAAWRKTIYVIMGAMALLMIVLVAVLVKLRRQMRRMSVLQTNLRAANTAKEVYISQFLQLCSIYMDKLNSFCKIATRKLAAGQSEELYRMTKSGKFVEEQSREFYEVFDNAFLHIYPNFVAQVNALLRPEERIELRPGELLNTDLRILAFMRLGIEESARIAQVLNYSLNTIYAYRNRLKARALNRETFEADIQNITSVG